MEDKVNFIDRPLLNICDYQRLAKQKLPRQTYDFYSTGADDQVTLGENLLAFRRIQIRPRVLVNVSSHFSND